MGLNKDLILRFVLSIGLVIFIARVLFPIILDKIRGKNLGLSKDTHDIDYLIKSKKEHLISKSFAEKSQETSSSTRHSELEWGNNNLVKEIRSKISKDFGTTYSENKITNFTNKTIKEKIFNELFDKKSDLDSMLNFILVSFIFNEVINEMLHEELSLLNKLANKIQLNPHVLALAIQIKLLKQLKKQDSKIDEYTNYLCLRSFNNEKIILAIKEVTTIEGALWKKGLSSFYEELSLNITYAQYLIPLTPIKSNQDLFVALRNINCSEKDNLDEIKKKYKKLALLMHPDKITPLKLPKQIEKQAIDNFNIIQQSYDFILEIKKT